MAKDFYVICDNIRSLENIGSIFRTADALGVTKIFLCGISGTPPNQKISKAALGAEKTVPFEYYKHTWRLIKKLKKDNIYIVALENNLDNDKITAPGGVPPKGGKSVIYTNFRAKFPMALIMGNEVKGISKKTLIKVDKIIYLTMMGKKESLNVSVAFGVAGYEINKHRAK